MNWKRLARSVCCLLVVCVLLFNIVTMPVRAAGVAVTVATVAAALVVGAVFIGLGAMPAASPAKFETAVNDCVADLTLKGLIADGIVHVAKIGAGVQAVQAVGQDFVEAVREWLFAHVFTVSPIVYAISPSGYSSTKYVASSYETNAFMFAGFQSVDFPGTLDWESGSFFFDTSSGVYHTAVFASELFSLSDGEYTVPAFSFDLYGVKSVVSGKYNFRFTLFRANSDGTFTALRAFNQRYDATSGAVPLSNRVISAFDFMASSAYQYCFAISFLGMAAGLDYPCGIQFHSMPQVLAVDEFVGEEIVADGMTVGVVGNLAEDLSVAYPSWVENAVVIEGSQLGKEDEKYLVYPFPSVNTMDDVLGLTQENVWSETQTDSGSVSKPITGTFADTAVGSFLEALMDALLTPLQWLLDQLLAGLKALFVPSSDYLSAKVDALRAEFSFADGIISTAESIRDIFNDSGQEPPVIYIDLGATRGSYDIGGEMKFIDMSWYAEYKPTVDKLLSGLIWLFFCWQTFKRLPGIISGIPGDFVMDGITAFGLEDRLPSRKAAYEIQRASNRASIRRGK